MGRIGSQQNPFELAPLSHLAGGAYAPASEADPLDRGDGFPGGWESDWIDLGGEG